jgi:hypothetical protein
MAVMVFLIARYYAGLVTRRPKILLANFNQLCITRESEFNKMAKYDPLKEYLYSLPENTNDITLSFEQVESIIKEKLPYSAFNYRAWWSNEVNGVLVSVHAWMDAGWKVDYVNQTSHWVRFIRQQSIPQGKSSHLNSIPDVMDIAGDHKTTVYSANSPNKTLVIHKPECRLVPWDKLSRCGCGDAGELGNQQWFCETHITRDTVNEFMNGHFWAILMCDICFRGG